LNIETAGADNIIPFPPRLRVVSIEPSVPLSSGHDLALIEHDGRLYDLAALVRNLSPAELQVIAAAGPRSSQEMWDHVMRCWPAMAAEIVAGARPVG
jgi:hypothetical protein